jgi:hypothetical protein
MMSCPLCRRPVGAPDRDEIIERHRLTPIETAVLEAVWDGKGLLVQAAVIFDAMYADDPDGGPTPTRMYATFKAALHGLEKKLKGTGVSVDHAGYRRGYRLHLQL